MSVEYKRHAACRMREGGDKASAKALCPQRNQSLGQRKETRSQRPAPVPSPRNRGLERKDFLKVASGSASEPRV